jgi:hypothetical protein
MEAHGVGAQDEHFIPTSNGWTNKKSELGYPTIRKELRDDGSTRLGGPFKVGQILLQQFRAFGNRGHSLSNGDAQVTNYAYNLGLHMGDSQMMQMRKCQWSHNLMKKGDAYGK